MNLWIMNQMSIQVVLELFFEKKKRLMAFDVNSQFLQTGLKNYLNQSIAYF